MFFLNSIESKRSYLIIKQINNHIVHLLDQRMSNPIKNRKEVIRERKKQGFLDACEYED